MVRTSISITMPILAEICKGVRLSPARPFEPKTRPIFDATQKASLIPNGMGFDMFAARLRRSVLNEQLKTGNFVDIELTPEILTKALSVQARKVSSYAPIYDREEVTDIDEARVWMNKFLSAMAHLVPPETFDPFSEPKTFFVRGPIETLRIGLPDASFPDAALPHINIPDGTFYYVRPVLDNLAMLQFRVLKRGEELVGKYAFDASVPEIFSAYSYNTEEQRQFGNFNKELLTDAERHEQSRGLDKLRCLCRLLMLGKKDFDPSIKDAPKKFKIAGPARRIDIKLTDKEYAKFSNLRLEPAETYWIEIIFSQIPGMGIEVPAVKFSPISGNGPSSTHYYLPDKKVFCQIFARSSDKAGRAVLPHNFQPKVWDDEGESPIIL